MAFTRSAIRAAVESAGDEHWQALIRHHEEAYPESRPTPGDVCRAEAQRLNQLDLSASQELTLVARRLHGCTDLRPRVRHDAPFYRQLAHYRREPLARWL